MRLEGNTFREIGTSIGVGSQRAREMYNRHLRWVNRPPDWRNGLSVRAWNCISFSLIPINSVEELMAAYQAGKLLPGTKGVRNLGWSTYVEIAKFLGLPEPTKSKPICPHCGKTL